MTKDIIQITQKPCFIQSTKDRDSETTAVELITKTTQREAKSKDGTTVLLCKLQYPQIKVNENLSNQKSMLEVNRLIEIEAMQKFQEKCTEAVDFTNEFIGEIYQGNLPKPWLPFTVEYSYEVTWNRQKLLSFLATEFEWLGGAHPNTNYYGYIYDIEQGIQLTPSDLLTLDENGVKQYIADEMMLLYKKNPNDYFQDEVKELQKLDFKYGSYLNDEGLVFFFNAYEVAPYVRGKVEVPLKFVEHPELFRMKR